MKLQFFAVPAKWPEDAQQKLNAFCAQHRVTTLEKHFVDLGTESYWSICVTFIDGINLPILAGAANRRDRINLPGSSGRTGFLIYAQLRNLRKSLSEQDRLSMRKIKEVLRLKWASDMSDRKIAQSCNISRPAVAN